MTAQPFNGGRRHAYQPRGVIASLGLRKRLRLQDMHEHMLVTGAPGSGKTSCVVLPTVRKIVELGGAVVCFSTKGSDLRDYQRTIEQASGRYIALGFDAPNARSEYVFDLFGHLTESGATSTEIADVLVSAMNVVNQRTGASSANENDFFRDLARALLVHIITCLQSAGLSITAATITSIMNDARAKAGTSKHAKIARVLRRAEAARKAEQTSAHEARRIRAAIRFLDKEWPELADRTASSVIGVWTGISVDLEVGLAGLIDAPDEDQIAVSPATALEDGVSLIIGPPTEASPRGGIIMQALWQACIRIGLQNRTPSDRTVVMVLDEFQASVSVHYLQMLLAMARSSRVGVLLATQSFATVTARFGAEAAKSLFGLPATVVSCRNDCPTTNTFSAERIGKHFIKVPSTSSSSSTPEFFSTGSGNRQSGISWSEQERFIVSPATFRNLKGAGPRRARTDAIVQQRGYHCKAVWYRDRTQPHRAGATQRKLQIAAVIAIVGITGISGLDVDNQPTSAKVAPTARRARRPIRRPATHYVRRGETFGGIARRYRVSLKAMKEANPLVAPDRIEVGALLRIPQP